MRKIIFSVLALATVLFTGCENYLDTADLTHKNTSNYPQTYSDAQQVIAGIYNNLNVQNANPQMTFLMVSELAADDRFGGGGVNDKMLQALDLMMNYQPDMLRQFWIDRYVGIFRANNAIETLGNCSGYPSDDAKNQILGEAYFLRAFYYYELASEFENIPLVLKSADGNKNFPQANPVTETWPQIISDLKKAIGLMPAKSFGTLVESGHVDKWTAEAMMARAFLFYTGFYSKTDVTFPDNTTVTKADVISWIDDCVTNSGYSLVPNFCNLWAYTNRLTKEDYKYTAGKGLKWVEDDNAVNPESMFAIKFSKFASWSTTIGYSNGYALFMGIRGGQAYANTFPFGQGWGAGPVAPKLWSDWVAKEPNDMRREASIINIPNDMPAYTKGGWSDFVQETDYWPKKWTPVTAKNGTGYYANFDMPMYGIATENMQLNNIHDLVMIRFADVLLMQSELKQDATGLNLVRNRAGLNPIAYSDEALRNERRWELCFEGVRWNDIRRWKIAETVLAEQSSQSVYYCGNASENTTTNNGGGYLARYQATRGFFKIPETEISLSNNVLKQNEGWGNTSDYISWR